MQTFVLNFHSLKPEYSTAQHSTAQHAEIALQYKSSNQCDMVKINNLYKHYRFSPTKYWITSCIVSVSGYDFSVRIVSRKFLP